MLEEYSKCKNKREDIYDNIAEGIKVRSKSSWHKKGEKSSIFFYAVQGIFTKLEIENKEISDPNELMK